MQIFQHEPYHWQRTFAKSLAQLADRTFRNPRTPRDHPHARGRAAFNRLALDRGLVTSRTGDVIAPDDVTPIVFGHETVNSRPTIATDVSSPETTRASSTGALISTPFLDINRDRRQGSIIPGSL